MPRTNAIRQRVKLLGGQLTFRFDGTEEWLKRLDNFRTTATNMRPVYEEFGAYMLRSIDRNFEAEGRPNRWKPLAESTIRERIRLGFGRGPILQRTGTLRRGFSTQAGQTRLKILNGVPYYRFHQQDRNRNRGRLPRRAMVVLLDQDKAQFTKTFRKHIKD